MVMSALSCLWDDPDICPQVRVDGVTGRRYCRMCGSEPTEVAEARERASDAARREESDTASGPEAG